jgi:hypothetical protein
LKLSNWPLCVIPITLILSGIAIMILEILFYPISLPKVITSGNSPWIQLSGYIFYMVFITSIIIVIAGIRKIIRCIELKFNNYDGHPNKQKKSSSSSLFHPPISESDSSTPSNARKQTPTISVWKIFFNMITDKKSAVFFVPVAVFYGLFYAIITSTLIIHLEGGISHISGIEEFPSIIMMQYGPAGYTPAMSIYLSDYIGILIIPINLITIIIISALVGLNAVSSAYTLKSYRSEKKRKVTADVMNGPKNGTRFLSMLGATTSLFAVCPTCTSFYLFNILAGSLATTIASFTVTYYELFLSLSVPLLIIAPFINAINIKKMKMDIAGQCKINKKK